MPTNAAPSATVIAISPSTSPLAMGPSMAILISSGASRLRPVVPIMQANAAAMRSVCGRR